MAFTQEQLQNAQIIAQVGKNLGASSRDVLIALMTAMQESGLRNLNYGDRDSVGLFQQRNAWGSYQQRMDPFESARMFFQGGHAGQRGLFDFSDREQMSLTQAAQAVQVSAFPDAYAKHEDGAREILKSLDLSVPIERGTAPVAEPTLGDIADPQGMLTPDPLSAQPAPGVMEVNGLGEITVDEVGLGDQGSFGGQNSPGFGALDAPEFQVDAGGRVPTSGATGGGGGSNPMSSSYMPSLEDFGVDWGSLDGPPPPGLGGNSGATGWRKNVVKAAEKMLGTPYVWGGTSYSGVDCSGLIQLLYGKEGINLPRVSFAQANSGKRVALSDLQPGDLVAWDNSSRNNGADHIAIYIGNGRIIEAPRPGGVVQVNDIYDTGRAWGVSMGAYDPPAGSSPAPSSPARPGKPKKPSTGGARPMGGAPDLGI